MRYVVSWYRLSWDTPSQHSTQSLGLLMAKPITPSYPITGKRANEMIVNFELANRGEVLPEQVEKTRKNAERALKFFKNPTAAVSGRK